MLAVTGAEALYADMGHFGARAHHPRLAVPGLPGVHPQLLGQGALILERPADTSAAPFFLLAPDWARLPLVVLATAATVIASQAVITGAFSVASQAAQLGYLPRLRIAHTSASTDRPDLRAVDQLAADGLGADPGVRVRSRRRWPTPSAWR